MKNIESSDIQFHSLSIVDRSGKLFIKGGELYRAIGHEKIQLYTRLFERGIVSSLIQKNILVDTRLTDYHLSGYDLVLHHRSIPFVSYPYEWSDTMFKDATLLHVNLLIELGKNNLATDDAGSLNILFDGYRPVFIDFCSIATSNEKPLWPGAAYEQFKCTFLSPLKIMAQGQARIARAVMRDSYYIPTRKLELEYGIFDLGTTPSSGIAAIKRKAFESARKSTPSSIRPILKTIFSFFQQGKARSQLTSQTDFLSKLRKRIVEIELPEVQIRDSECFDNAFPSLLSSEGWTEKQKHIHQVLISYKPDSFLDADSDQGWYAQLAALNGSKVVAFDGDEACVRKLYADAKNSKLYIVPLLIDFASPKFDLCNDFFVSVNERLSCEMVMCLTLLQHLLLKRRLTLEKALARLSHLSGRWVLLEFIPPDQLLCFIPSHNQFAMEAWKDGCSYPYEEFLQVLTKVFSEVKPVATYENGKRLLLCRTA